MQRFWGKHDDLINGPSSKFNLAFYRNTFRIGGADLGIALAKRGIFDHHLKLSANGWNALKHLMFSMNGQVLNENISQHITKLDLSDSTFKAELAEFEQLQVCYSSVESGIRWAQGGVENANLHVQNLSEATYHTAFASACEPSPSPPPSPPPSPSQTPFPLPVPIPNFRSTSKSWT